MNERKTWLIISWQHNDYLDGKYGRKVGEFKGTYEEAAEEARKYIAAYSPIGVVGVIE